MTEDALLTARLEGARLMQAYLVRKLNERGYRAVQQYVEDLRVEDVVEMAPALEVKG